MDLGIFWRALVVQALAVGVLFGVLLLLPLEREFFRDYGAAIGPLAWAASAIVTARALSLALAPVLLSALAAGAVGLAAGLAIGHGPGLLVSLPLFAAGCAASHQLERRMRASRSPTATQYPQPDSNRRSSP